jgi:DUF971 family protein
MTVPGTSLEFLPQRVKLDRDNRSVLIGWGDGHTSVYDWEYLRWRCPCAHCQGEGGRPGELETLTAFRPEQTVMEDLEMVGRYALAPIWQDGHRTGIYTWRNLRGMCPDCEQPATDD